MIRADYDLIILQLKHNLNSYYSAIKRMMIDEKQDYLACNKENLNKQTRTIILKCFKLLVEKLTYNYRKNFLKLQDLVKSKPIPSDPLTHPALKSIKSNVYYVRSWELLPLFQRAYPLGYLFSSTKNIDSNMMNCLRLLATGVYQSDIIYNEVSY